MKIEATLEGVFDALAAQPPRRRGGGRALMFIAARRGEGVTTSVRMAAETSGAGAVYALDLDLRRNALAKHGRRSMAASTARASIPSSTRAAFRSPSRPPPLATTASGARGSMSGSTIRGWRRQAPASSFPRRPIIGTPAERAAR
jgi:hypothetical protein